MLSYQLEELYPLEQYYRLLQPDTMTGEGKGFDMSVYWNWYVAGSGRIAVVLGVRAMGTKEVPEEVRATAVAVFSIQRPEPDVPLQTFLQRDGPAMMVPYLQEIFTSLTARSRTGILNLLPFDLSDLPETHPFTESAGYEFLMTTAGAAKELEIPFSRPKKVGRKRKKSDG